MNSNRLSKKQILLVSLTALIFVVIAVAADMIYKAEHNNRVAAASTVSNASPSVAVYSELNSKLNDDLGDEAYEPGPTVLNLAYYYPDESETDDVINSYAGRIFTHMTELEAQYLAGFYDLYDTAPITIARQLGYGSERVKGTYDPTNPSHDPNVPSTWTVDHFKNINISFYDGDGNRINQYSAVKEIISMASVYSYYHDMMDAEAMGDYAEALWSSVHTSSVKLGNVYYCSGCLNRTVEEEANEALEQEKQQQELWNALAEATAKSAGDAALRVLGMQGDGTSSAEAVTEASSAEVSQETLAETSGYVYVPESASQAQSVSETAASGAIVSESSMAQETGTTQGLSGVNDAVSAIISGLSQTESVVATQEQTTQAQPGSETAATLTEPQTEISVTAPSDDQYIIIGDNVFRRSTGLGYDDYSYTETGSSAATASDAPEAAPTEGSVQPVSTAAATEAQTLQPSTQAPETRAPSAQTTVQQRPVSAASQQKSSCPGHIDIYVTINIKGIDDMNGLIEADAIGNDPAGFNDKWQGWTEERIEEAKELNAQDWFSRYGLTISAINVSQPLSTDEISYYMSLLPDDSSQLRKDVIEYALSSVGKVPYYWGGKPYGAGYERNSFGTVTWPDEKGRVLRGLDCSGWINWVYWSVTGSSLPGESTGTLVGCGRKINRSDLRPGDIIIRTGADAHVVMFLCWTENGSMLVVHETGGITNNVVVSEMTADWPYYRTLIYD